MIDLLSDKIRCLREWMRIKHQSHTLDEIEGRGCECIFAKYLAAQLQTLAEKIANTIYRAAKVCSYQSASADKLLIYLGRDIFTYFSFCLSNVWVIKLIYYVI